VLNRLKTALIARSVAPIAASKARSWEVLTKVTPAVMSVGTPRYIVPTDEFIGPGVWHNGTWDADVHHWALNALGNPHRGRLFVDVGAHVGTTTIPAALDGAYVHAFEPVRTNYALLVANLHLNGLEDNVGGGRRRGTGHTPSTDRDSQDGQGVRWQYFAVRYVPKTF
jgi:hypothetical protein